jgi:YVTN family beta-propeller protein
VNTHRTNHLLHRRIRLLGAAISLALLAAVGLSLVSAPVRAAQQAPGESSPLCIDAFEPDDSPGAASLIDAGGAVQVHTLHVPANDDWIAFDAQAGAVLAARTFDLLLDTDTVLRLYDVDGVTLLAVNDDYAGSTEPLASQIVWTAPADGRYFLMVRDYYARGDCLGYSLMLEARPLTSVVHVYLPDVQRAVVPTATPTPTATEAPTASPTPTATATPSETPTATPSPTVTDTPTAGPTATETPTATDTPTATATPTVTVTPTTTETSTVTNTPSITASPTATATATATPTATPTATATATPTATPEPIIRHVPYPNGIAADVSANTVFIGSKTPGRLYRVDGASNTVLASYASGSEPFGVAVNSVTHKVYVANYASNTVTIFNGATGGLLATVNFAPLGFGQPAYVAVDETLNRAYVTLHAGGRVAVIDGATNALLTTMEAQSGAFGLAVHPGLQRAYVSNRDTGTINVFDTSTNSRLWPQTTSVGGEPYALTVDPLRNRLYVLYALPGSTPDRVAVYSLAPSGASRIGAVAVQDGGVHGGTGIAANPATGHVFAANSAHNTITVIDGPTMSVLATVAAGRDPGMIGVNPVTNKVYVGNRGDHTVQVIDDTFMRRLRWRPAIAL